MDFSNVYNDAARADAYARLEHPGTYFLAFRDIPALLARHTSGHKALDFGSGAGRSTRFLRSQGFEAIGVDISAAMVAKARERDLEGRYVAIQDGDFSALQGEAFDVIFAAVGAAFLATAHPQHTLGYVPYVLLLLCPLLHLFGHRGHTGHGLSGHS